MAERGDDQSAVRSAAVGALAMIAHQVASKATRDALFLSNFDVQLLPLMLSASAVFSILIALGAARLMTRLSPSRVVPAAFVASGLIQIVIWGLAFLSPSAAAVLLYVHIAAFGSILVSGFWSMYNERLDPRSAKAHIGRVVGSATLGGVLGGLLAQAAALYLGLSSMLPLLAGLDLFCGWAVLNLRQLEASPQNPSGKALEGQEAARSGFQMLQQTPYLRNLALLILLATVSAALIDYVFKFWAQDTFRQGEPLLSFFAAFYMVVSILTFLTQTAASRRALEKLGLAKTVAGLPAAAALGAGAGLALPGMATLACARGAEATLRNSLFRSGYELFFTPVPDQERRATKTLIDVGAERMGDALGGGIALLLLLLGSWANPLMLALAFSLSLLGLAITRSLDRGYVQTLERSLLGRALDLEMAQVGDKTTRTTLLRTMTGLDIRQHLGEEAATASGLYGPTRPEKDSDPQPEGLGKSLEADSVLKQTAVLRSQDAQPIARLFEEQPLLDPLLAAHVIPLLAWDRLSDKSIQALRNIAPQIAGQLVDALLDKEQEFAVRRRLPRVLAFSPSQRASEGLLRALRDRRFEVRYQSGQALFFMTQRNSSIRISGEPVFEAVLRELDVDEGIWESHRLLDGSDEEMGSDLVDDLLRKRINRSLEHIFTILSLVLPREPLKVAFKGLYTQDAKLRGTALEYLDSVLPDPIRGKLWPFLEKSEGGQAERPRPKEEILLELLRSSPSIELSLAEVEKKLRHRDQEGRE
ncbi:MAG: hypothetical protein V3T83_06690 [Acidobacteriota bacterium]